MSRAFTWSSKVKLISRIYSHINTERFYLLLDVWFLHTRNVKSLFSRAPMNEICSINVAMQDREELNHNPGCTLKPGRQEVITLSICVQRWRGYLESKGVFMYSGSKLVRHLWINWNCTLSFSLNKELNSSVLSAQSVGVNHYKDSFCYALKGLYWSCIS